METKVPAIVMPPDNATSCDRDNRHSHRCRYLEGMFGDAYDAALPDAGISPDREDLSRLGLLLMCHPCRDAASPIARYLGDRSVDIKKTNSRRAIPRPPQKLHAVGAESGVPRAQPDCQLPLVRFCDRPRINDQKVIAARMRFHKRDQLPSELQNISRSQSIPASSRRCLLRFATS